jgi:hypothetical protein
MTRRTTHGLPTFRDRTEVRARQRGTDRAVLGPEMKAVERGGEGFLVQRHQDEIS